MATTIDSKPAAGLLGGAISTLAIGVCARYTSYDPTIEEAGAIVTVVSFGLAWLVPSKLWSKYPAEAVRAEVDGMASEPHEGGA